jgi:hypothetical protein
MWRDAARRGCERAAASRISDFESEWKPLGRLLTVSVQPLSTYLELALLLRSAVWRA